jgi:hydroxyacylglutathione hydrolase
VRIVGFPVGPLQANAFLAVCEETRKCALVDPGEEAERLIEAAEEERAEIISILLTHAHLDHVGGVAEVKTSLDVPVYLHPADLPLYKAAPIQARSFGLELETPPDPDFDFEDGQIVEIGRSGIRLAIHPATCA